MAKIAIFSHFFEVTLNSAAWLQLGVIELKSTTFMGNFESIHSSGSVLISNFIFIIEFAMSGNSFHEKSFCVGSILFEKLLYN